MGLRCRCFSEPGGSQPADCSAFGSCRGWSGGEKARTSEGAARYRGGRQFRSRSGALSCLTAVALI